MDFFQLDQNFPIALYNVTGFLDYLVKYNGHVNYTNNEKYQRI